MLYSHNTHATIDLFPGFQPYSCHLNKLDLTTESVRLTRKINLISRRSSYKVSCCCPTPNNSTYYIVFCFMVWKMTEAQFKLQNTLTNSDKCSLWSPTTSFPQYESNQSSQRVVVPWVFLYYSSLRMWTAWYTCVRCHCCLATTILHFLSLMH